MNAGQELYKALNDIIAKHGLSLLEVHSKLNEQGINIDYVISSIARAIEQSKH